MLTSQVSVKMKEKGGDNCTSMVCICEAPFLQAAPFCMVGCASGYLLMPERLAGTIKSEGKGEFL